MRRRIAIFAAAWLAAGALVGGVADEPPSPPSPPAPQAPRGPELPWLGVLLGDEIDGGVKVVAVIPSGPAARAGLRTGDLVLVLNGLEVTDQDVVAQVLDSVAPGDALGIQVLRGRQVLERTIRTVARPSMPVLAPAAVGAIEPRVRVRTIVDYRRVLGVTLVQMSPELRQHYGAPRDTGLLVARVRPGEPAARAGFLVGDVVIRACGVAAHRPRQVTLCLVHGEGSEELVFEVVRARQQQVLNVALPQEYAAEVARRAATTRAADAARLLEDANRSRAMLIEREIARLKKRLAELEKELERLK